MLLPDDARLPRTALALGLLALLGLLGTASCSSGGGGDDDKGAKNGDGALWDEFDWDDADWS